MKLGIVADDTTGANDIGAMCAKHGWATAVVAHDAPDPLPAADALVLDTHSRLDPPERAYAKVYAATQRLRAWGCDWLHKKTCSVFRGNIGAEFDALLDASGGDFLRRVFDLEAREREVVRAATEATAALRAGRDFLMLAEQDMAVVAATHAPAADRAVSASLAEVAAQVATATGIPAELAVDRPLLLVLKSGSLGAADFLRTAVAHTHALGAPEGAVSS